MHNSFRDATLRPSIDAFFSQDIAASRSFLHSHLEFSPEDGLAYALLAAVEFYDTVIGWMLSGGEISVGALLRGKCMKLDQDRSVAILASLANAEKFAERALGDDDSADMGLFALSLVSSIRRDYEGLVLSRWAASLTHAREANLLGRKLLKANPKAHDAYCIFAWNEYLVSRMPVVARPLAKIPGITGNRSKAIQFCKVASRSGCYFRELALCLLVALYTDERNDDDASGVLTDLAHRFPKNSTVAAELKRRLELAAGA